jgi:hypothetical protein
VSGQGPVWAPRLRLLPAKIGKSRSRMLFGASSGSLFKRAAPNDRRSLTYRTSQVRLHRMQAHADLLSTHSKYTISDSIPHRTASSLPPLKQDISSSSSAPPSKYLSPPASQNSTSSVPSPVSFQANRQFPDPNCDSSQNIPHV